ncbi:MAG: hypothetical protein NTY35_04105 [Planctomycetota bacterium]|nr:hypothetical protein [Planctomycetota bacterium]
MSCSPAEPSVAVSTPAAAREFPPGTVLALNATPIRAEDVDAVASIIARVEPQNTLPHLRRIALTNVILPLVAARQVAGPEKRAASLALASAWRAALVRGETPPAPVTAPLEEVTQGGFGMVGLEVWNWALDCPVGAWSEPIETVGAWRVAHLLERSAGLRPTDVVLKVDLRTFVWDPSESFREDVEAHLDRSKLEFLDEVWRDFVPTTWQRRLRGSP